jgi:uncharacterized protein YeeX (DUF496 family)
MTVVITKITVVITTMTDDYEDDVITKITVVITKMIDDYQDDW